MSDADKSGSTDSSKESMLLLGNPLLCFWNMHLLTNPQFSLENRSEKKDVFLNCFLTVKKHRQAHKIRENSWQRMRDKTNQICFHMCPYIINMIYFNDHNKYFLGTAFYSNSWFFTGFVVSWEIFCLWHTDKSQWQTCSYVDFRILFIAVF